MHWALVLSVLLFTFVKNVKKALPMGTVLDLHIKWFATIGIKWRVWDEWLFVVLINLAFCCMMAEAWCWTMRWFIVLCCFVFFHGCLCKYTDCPTQLWCICQLMCLLLGIETKVNDQKLEWLKIFLCRLQCADFSLYVYIFYPKIQHLY